jgi:REP element-mobilizing transposase RayT
MHLPGEIHLVTNRCEEGRFFLLPTQTVNVLIRYWLARAKVEVGDAIDIFAFCFSVNHFHLLLRDNGGGLAKFMGYFQGNLARAINEHLGPSPLTKKEWVVLTKSDQLKQF